MARFPTREEEVRALAENLAAGLTADPTPFPAPPIPPAALQARIAAYIAARDAAIAAHEAARQATADKAQALAALTRDAKATLHYVEYIANGDEAKLRLVGWGKRRPRTREE